MLASPPSPATTLVTGATGFLGTHLMQRLLQSTAPPTSIRILTREAQPHWADLGVEVVRGDLQDTAALSRATQGIEVVYHLAGRVERSPEHAHQMYALHVEGTKALLDALSKHASPKSIVVASTSGTVGISTSPEVVATDDSPWVEEIARSWPYYLSKIYAEKVCQDYVQRHGMPIVLMRPSLLLGPGDERESSTKDVVLFLKKKIPLIPQGGLSFVDVRDAADAFIQAAALAPAGATYLLGAENVPLQDYFKRLEHLSGVRGPLMQAKKTTLTKGARLLQGALGMFGKAPDLDPTSVEMGGHYWYIDSSRAKRELGFSPRPAQDTLKDTLDWIRRYHPDFSHDFADTSRRTPPAEFVTPEMLEFAKTLRQRG